MIELWKSVPGACGYYEISDHGRVRSLPRDVHIRGGYRRTKTRILKLCRRDDGYLSVILHKDGELVRWFVHRMVLAAFVGPCPIGEQVAHNNGLKDDNRLINLRYATPKDNQRDRISHGTHGAGERHSGRKLSRCDVDTIRGSIEKGRVLAVRYGVHESVISRIRCGKLWAAECGILIEDRRAA